MSITSFYFLCLFALALLLYYLVPKKSAVAAFIASEHRILFDIGRGA
ncbi:MAG: hypothetical protein ACLU3U_13895 [Gallintestinimicrobium sp.]